MNFYELVKKRKSIRSYSDKKVDRKLIDKCLETARIAPSACNSQPWSFIVIDNKETIEKIVKESCSGLYSLNKFIKTAPVIIVIVTEKSKIAARLGGQIRSVEYNLIDIGIVGDHLTLQAAELGLGTCWLGWFNAKGLKKALNLPDEQKIDIMLSLGYPDTTPPKQKTRKSLDEIRKYYKPES